MEDADTAQTDTLTARAKKDTFFDMLDGDTRPPHRRHVGLDDGEGDDGHRQVRRHHHDAQGRDGRGHATSGTVGRPRQGQQLLRATRAGRGEQAAVEVSGRLPGGVGRDRPDRGGLWYAISEPDPLGAIASVDPSPVTVTKESLHEVTVANESDRPPEPPDPGPEPPTSRRSRCCRPGRPSRSPAPTSSSPRRWAAARIWPSANDLATRQRGRRCGVGHRPRAQLRPAAGGRAVVREIPQVDPRHPNQVARILGVTPTIRVARVHEQPAGELRAGDTGRRSRGGHPGQGADAPAPGSSRA